MKFTAAILALVAAGVNATTPIDEVLFAQSELSRFLNYDASAAQDCSSRNDLHERCVYDFFLDVGRYDCHCRELPQSVLFREIDVNPRDDVITFQEMKHYVAQWCSTVTTLPHHHHVNGNMMELCDGDDDALLTMWQDFVSHIDHEVEEQVSYVEFFSSHIEEGARRHHRRHHRGLFLSEEICDDCNPPEECTTNPLENIIGEACHNYVKTVPLNDEQLLRILADASVDVYDGIGRLDELVDGVNTEEQKTYMGIPLLREGTNNWIEREEFHPLTRDPNLTLRMVCLAMSNFDLDFESLSRVFETITKFTTVEQSSPVESVIQSCSDVLAQQRAAGIDGRDNLQFATYVIQQGPHQDKKILSFMGSFSFEQFFVSLGIMSPTASEMVHTMLDAAVDVHNEVRPDYVTGHSLGGSIAEYVCSETGTPGASFAALGLFDPFTVVDEWTAVGDQLLQGSKIGQLASEMANYDGYIHSNLHNGVPFEAVMNSNDLVAREFAGIEGSQCSHIAKSCDVRHLWFSSSLLLGHSVVAYAAHSTYYFTHGWDQENGESLVNDPSKIFLPGVEKNKICDYCDVDEFCTSTVCNLNVNRCAPTSGKFPLLCPTGTARADERAVCAIDDDCESGICDKEKLCSDKRPALTAIGGWCAYNSDCESGRCTNFFTCQKKLSTGEMCINAGDCLSGTCRRKRDAWFSTCT